MGFPCPVVLWILELIDTLWNVNDFQVLPVLSVVYELIDTLWNVNELMSVFQEVADMN